MDEGGAKPGDGGRQMSTAAQGLIPPLPEQSGGPHGPEGVAGSARHPAPKQGM